MHRDKFEALSKWLAYCQSKGDPVITVSIGDMSDLLEEVEQMGELQHQVSVMRSQLSFSLLRDANQRRAAQWNNGSPTGIEFSAVELAGEAGEVCNSVKKLMRHQRGMAGGVADVQPIAAELADLVISADLLAAELGIDLGEAVARKFNATSRKHGFQVELPVDPEPQPV